MPHPGLFACCLPSSSGADLKDGDRAWSPEPQTLMSSCPEDRWSFPWEACWTPALPFCVSLSVPTPVNSGPQFRVQRIRSSGCSTCPSTYCLCVSV